jgi:hypothetical protein
MIAVLDHQNFKAFWVDDDGDPVAEITRPGFPNEPQRQYLTSQRPYVFLWGNRGKGSTESIVWDAIFTAHAIPGEAQLIMRRTMPELESTIISRMLELPREIRGRYVAKSGSLHFLFPNGHRVYLQSAKEEKDVKKYLSRQLVKLHIDEWCDFPYLQWRQIAGSVRTPIERDKYSRIIVPQVKGGGNPVGISSDEMNHVFGCDVPKAPALGDDPESYKPEEYEGIFASIDANPSYAKGTIQGDAYRRILASAPASIKAAWVEGRFGIGEGSYFQNWVKELAEWPHDLGLKLMHEQRWQPIWIGTDIAGDTGHFFSTHWATFLELNIKARWEPGQDGGKWVDAAGTVKLPYIYREWSDRGLGERALAAEIMDRTPQDEKKRIDAVYLSPDAGFEDPILSRGARMGDVYVAQGVVRARPAFNSRIDGAALLYSALDERYILASDEEVCGILIDDTTCPLLMRAIPAMMCDPKKQGDVLKTPGQLDDVYDSARYTVASRKAFDPAAKPFDVRLKERLQGLPVAGSARTLATLKMQEAERRAQTGFVNNAVIRKGHIWAGQRRK